MPHEPHILVATDLHKSFGNGVGRVHVLRGGGLSVRRGEFLAVMGPSGCGKSTLLHVLGLMTPPDVPGKRHPLGPDAPQTRIELDGQLVGARESARTLLRREKIGFVFQRFNLLGMLSGADNVAISLRVRRRPKDPGRIADLFEAMGVSHVAHRRPGQMSIGEQQRLAIVRALAHEPAILLADEPTGNLDSQNAERLLELFRQINRDAGQTIVMITHSSAAAAHADRIAHMKDGRLDG